MKYDVTQRIKLEKLKDDFWIEESKKAKMKKLELLGPKILTHEEFERIKSNILKLNFSVFDQSWRK